MRSQRGLILLIILLLTSQAVLAASSQYDRELLRTSALLTGALCAGESISLLIGQSLADPDNTWSTPKNNWLLLSDLVTGLGMVYLAHRDKALYDSSMLFNFAAVSTMTHAYREWEYFGDDDNKFCTNEPLFLSNTIKLLGSLFVTGKVLALRVSW
ncbi:MAG: hypothetical protein JW782_03410 [Candidatus Saganbacteria bacterium]|nr:hypothetical protein [Candidatus Saganbacteria bacterium]